MIALENGVANMVHNDTNSSEALHAENAQLRREGLKLTISATWSPRAESTVPTADEPKLALREMGMSEDITLKPRGG